MKCIVDELAGAVVRTHDKAHTHWVDPYLYH